MTDEKRQFADGQEIAKTNHDIGIGTPLKDSAETPLYVIQGQPESLVGIGPGTPLNDPDAVMPEEGFGGQEVSPAETALADDSGEGQPSADDEGDGDFAQELEQSMESEPELGEVVKGKIVRIDADGVIVDIGSKSEGYVPKQEFTDAAGEFTAKVGDDVEVLLERRENREGMMTLSKRKVDRRKGWNNARAALANGNSLEGKIYAKCKGGYMVDLSGVQSFLPASQLDIRQPADPDAFIGQTHWFKVIKVNKERSNIVVSRRNHLLEDSLKKKTEVIGKLTPGRLVHGVVKTLTNYGAFVDIGGVDALLHIKDMSWAKVKHPKQIVNVGDSLEVLVLSINEETGKVAVGLKQKNENPWINIESKYPVGSIVEGQVVSLMDFGAFLKLEEGVEGLLPVSELSWSKHVRHPKDMLKDGDSVRVKVLSVDAAAKRISLGLRQTEQDPFVVFTENHKVGDVVAGVVRSIAPFGAFVELIEGVSGLLHISDLSWDGSIKNPGDVVKVGDSLKVKVLEINAEKKKISLGLKQLGEDPWTAAAKKYPMGASVKVKVVRNTKFGVFVQIEPGIEGLIHVSQLEREKGAEPKPLPEGETIEAKVIKVNWKEHKIGLSVRELLEDQEEAEMKRYLSPTNKPGMTLGEISGISREELLKRVTTRGQE